MGEKTRMIIVNVYLKELKSQGYAITNVDYQSGIISAFKYRGRGKRKFKQTTNFEYQIN